MMMSEFIERTGFEPTAEEYEIIEEEYMGGADDKDTFCKNWKKNGGVQRLTRARAAKLMDYECRVRVLVSVNAKIIKEKNKVEVNVHNLKGLNKSLEDENAKLKEDAKLADNAMEKLKYRINELERQLEEYKAYDEQIKAVRSLISAFSK